MTQPEQQKAAKTFAENWNGKGDEKQDSQRYWIGLLQNVLGVRDAPSYIEFEKRVKLSHTSFIDAYIPETKVLIEQKGIKINLDAPENQSDGTPLTPFQQAKRYASELPVDLHPRWIVVSNFKEIRVYDMNKPDEKPQVIFLKDLERDYYRLEFLVDRKNENIRREVDISVAAGALVGKMYDALVKEYINPTAESYRSLNILCVRLVFCFYAEDAGLFETRTSFEDYIKSFAIENLRKGLIDLFKALDTKLDSRDKYDTKLKPFPYVNGGLFHDENIEIPNFTQEIVDVLVNDCAPFNWSEISPTIFGAVFESTLNPETRRKGGMHYTSIENIHKVIDPLFLDELNEEFNVIASEAKQSQKQYQAALLNFQEKLGNLTFLDPACGSGNFLTETYISLRRLENKVISALNKGEKVLGFDEFIKVKINQFYGIEINDFAVTVAKTALWIAESQMINETEKIISQQIDFLPLTTNAFIVEGNALRMDWATLKPLGGNEMPADGLFAGITTHVDGRTHHYDYIMGNPPFVGARLMSESQKSDVAFVWGNAKNIGNVDYVSCWYKKAGDLIKNTETKCALVSTNSITQGEQVAIMWKPLFEEGIKIDFAYRTFRWDSESTEKAHVHCVIVGFSCKNKKECHTDSISLTRNQEKVIPALDAGICKGKIVGSSPTMTHGSKFIIDEKGEKHIAKNINGYLLDAPDVFVESKSKPVCAVPEIGIGNKPIDGGNYLFTEEEKADFLKKEPRAEKYFHKWLGSDEFLHGYFRWCLWLGGCSPAEIKKMPECYKRVQKVREFRLASKSEPTQKLADTPTRFHVENMPEGNYILIPRVSSEKRFYVPIGFIKKGILCSDSVHVLDCSKSNLDPVYVFGVLTSSVHMAWMRAVCGRLKSDYRYSKDIVYNNFVWPEINFPQNSQTDADKKNQNLRKSAESAGDFKSQIEQTAQAILDARAKYPDSSLADLYDETLMPADLRKAHEANDRAVMQAYGFDAKMTEAEVVAELFRLYEKQTR